MLSLDLSDDEKLSWAEESFTEAEALLENGEYAEALEALAQAAEFYRSAAHIGYTECQLSRANILSQLGQMADAAVLYEEHVKEVSAWLATAGPEVDQGPFTSSMLYAVERLGRHYFQQKQFDKAIKMLTTAKQVHEGLVLQYPLHPFYYRNYLLSVDILGDVLLANGQPENAYACYRLFHDEMEVLIGWAGPVHELPFDLARAYGKMAVVHEGRGQYKLALSLYKKAVRQYRTYWPTLGSNAEVQKEYGVALMDLGSTYAALSLQRAATKCLLAAENRLRALCEQFPENAWYPELHALSLNKMGAWYLASGQLDKALECYAVCLPVRVKLLEMQPELVQMRSGMAIVYMHIGDVLHRRQQFDAALVQYTLFYEQACIVAAFKPTFQGQQRLKGLAMGRLAAHHRATGDHAKALFHLQEQLQLTRELSRSFPDILQYKDDLAIVYQDLGVAWNAVNDLRRSLCCFLLSYRQTVQLMRQSPEETGYQAAVDWVVGSITALYTSLGRQVNTSL